MKFCVGRGGLFKGDGVGPAPVTGPALGGRDGPDIDGAGAATGVGAGRAAAGAIAVGAAAAGGVGADTFGAFAPSPSVFTPAFIFAMIAFLSVLLRRGLAACGSLGMDRPLWLLVLTSRACDAALKASESGSTCPTPGPSRTRAVVCFRKIKPEACCANRLPNHLIRITPTNIGCVQSRFGCWGEVRRLHVRRGLAGPARTRV